MHELKIKYKSIGSLNYSELCFSFREVAGLVVGVGRGVFLGLKRSLSGSKMLF